MKIKIELTIEANEQAVEDFESSGLEEALRNDFEASVAWALETNDLFDLVGEINYTVVEA